jgi:hypothetical protein
VILLWHSSASTEGLVTNVDPVNHGATIVRNTVDAKQYEKTAATKAPAAAPRYGLALSGAGAILFGTLFALAARHPRPFQILNLGRVFTPWGRQPQ